MTPPAEREALARAVRADFEARYTGRIEAACFYWALEAALALHRTGRRVCVQAGSLQWPSLAEDDGVSPTHFAYMWEPDSETTLVRVAAGQMPEVHCWVALPDDGELVDLSTKYLPAQAARLGVPWTAPPPPDYLWATAAEVPEGVLYAPDPGAIRWMLGRLAAEGWDPRRVVGWGLRAGDQVRAGATR